MRPKTTVKIILLVLALLGGAVLLLPQLLQLDRIQTEVARQLGERLGSPVRIGELKWSWFPLPHLTARDSEIDGKEASLVLPEARLYPNWRSFFQKEVELGKVVLVKPEITVKAVAAARAGPSGPDRFSLPPLRIAVKDGVVNIASKAFWGIRLKPVQLQALTGSLDISSSLVKVDLAGKPSFGKTLWLKGRYDIQRNSYALQLAAQGLQLQESIAFLAEGKVVPTKSIANIKADIHGVGLESVTANLVGEMPCFLYEPKDKKLLFNCGHADIEFKKTGPDIQVTVKDLELKDPGLKLSGFVRRSVTEKKAEPRWTIDLAGRDLDLAEIRAAVLTLFGNHYAAQEVGAIVLGGTAKKASFKFDGPAADFEELQSMVITAEAENASIHVPEVDLNITGATGQVVIRDGILNVTRASGRLAGSTGKNCTLHMGLLHKIPLFKLELDIDADVADLPPVLHNLVDHAAFRAELAQFGNVSGRASGHLSIGDTIHDFTVRVAVSSMKAAASYGRLVWPIRIDGGRLRVAPHRVRWEDVRGSLGPQRIRKFQGSVDWEKEEVLLDITKMDASVEGKNLLAGLKKYPEVARKLAHQLSELSGRIEVRDASLRGPALAPDQWRYKVNIDFKDVHWLTPWLAESVAMKSGRAVLTENEVELSGLAMRFYDSPFTLTGRLGHRLLDDWQGWVEINGAFKQQTAAWLKKQHWLPSFLSPRAPGQVRNLKIAWQHGAVSVAGSVLAGAGQEKPRLEFEVKSSPQDPLFVQFDVWDNEKHGHLVFDLLDQIPETFRFSWQGEVQAKTAAALFDQEEFLQGSIRGDWTVTVPAVGTPATFTGSLEAAGLRWYWNAAGSRFTDITEAHLTGQDDKAFIQKLNLLLEDQEEVRMSGEVSGVAKGLLLDLDLTSPSLSRRAVLRFLSNLDLLRSETGEEEKEEAEEGGAEARKSAWSVTGTVGFRLAEFVSGERGSEETAALASTLVWAPLMGRITLHPGEEVSAQITRGQLCCLDVTGVWHSDASLGNNRFHITTECPTPPKFQDVLPCIGVKQDVIEGEFSLTADLVGDLDNWQKGAATVRSTSGRILRMKLLSKVFSVVNLTDLFFGNDFPNFDQKGFAYTDLEVDTHIKNNVLIIDKAVIRGEGLNLFANGTMNLGTKKLDIVILIAPFKTLDTLVSKVPFVGRAVGGENAALITIPVGVKGDVKDPRVTILPPDAVGEGVLNLVKNTLLLPFNILSPILPGR